MFDTHLSDDINALRDSVKRLCDDTLVPRAAQIDVDNAFPMDMWKHFGDMGLLGLSVPEEFGGSGMGYLAHTVAMEEISRASGAVGLAYGAHSNLCVNNLYLNGNNAQRKKYLPRLCSGQHVGALAMSEPGAGSDVVGSMLCRAEKKGDRWIASGNKMWITNGPHRTKGNGIKGHDRLHRRKRFQRFSHRAKTRQTRHARLRHLRAGV